MAKVTLFPLSLPEISVIQSISPSRFQGMKECLLREALVSAKAKPMLPFSPKGSIGNISHKLIEEAAKGKAGPGKDSLKKRWDELAAEVECNLPQFQIPLSRSCGEYYVLKASTILIAEGVCQPSTQARGSASNWHFGAEKMYQTADGRIRGKIDQVSISPDGPVIRDYKTGNIVDLESQEVRESYKIQLMLYAAVYAEQTGTWPVAAELVAIGGRSFEVEINPTQCLTVVENAKKELDLGNLKLEKIKGGHSTPEEVATPSPLTCRYCGYRPCCPAYFKTERAEIEKWPNDIWGKLESITESPDGKWVAKVVGDFGTAVIRRLSRERYPNFSEFPENKIVGFFSLKRENAPNTYQEGPNTVLFS